MNVRKDDKRMDKTTNVKVIKPTIRYEEHSFNDIEKPKRKVCAYARVSTDNEEQKTSYEAQVDEYTKRINKNPDWKFISVFADEGISGTSIKKRDEFNKMIEMAFKKEIDLIITKSISRFARNTELTLKTVRELKEIGVEVYFEKENLWTFDPKVELFLTIFSSIAQEEARNISENVTWNVRKRMREGVPIINCKRFLGYDLDKTTNTLIIVPEEAKIVKMIFEMYVEGVGPSDICRTLMNMGVKTGAGKERWTNSSLYSILENEKYVGDLLQQKTYTVDYLSHKRIENKDKVQKYLIQNNHEPIIDRNTFEIAQRLRAERAAHRIGDDKNVAKYNNKYPLTHMIICVKCGKTLKRHYWNYGYPAQCIVRLCGNYIQGRDKCDAKAIKDDLIQQACLDVINNVFLSKNELLDTIKGAINQNVKFNEVELELENVKLHKESLEDELSKIIDMKLKNNDYEKNILEDKYKATSLELQTTIKKIKVLETKCLDDFSNNLRLLKINEFIKGYKNGVSELTAEVLNTFIAKLIAVDRNNIVICLHGNEKHDHGYYVDYRTQLIKMDPVYEGTAKLEQFKDTLNYKVIIV